MNYRRTVSYYSVKKCRTPLDGCFVVYRNSNKYLSNKIVSNKSSKPEFC